MRLQSREDIHLYEKKTTIHNNFVTGDLNILSLFCNSYIK